MVITLGQQYNVGEKPIVVFIPSPALLQKINRPLIGEVCAEWVDAGENIFISEGLSSTASLYFIAFLGKI